MSNNLTNYERQTLQYWLRSKMSLRDIAKIMKRTHSSLSKEINKNGCGDRKKYRADSAQKNYEKRQHKQRKSKMEKYPKLKEYVEKKLMSDWSPQQIAGRLKRHSLPESAGKKISHESIYYWIYEKSEKHIKLYKHLRTHRPKRLKQGKRKSKKTTIPSRISIHNRPETIDKKLRYGDWESDTVEFKRENKNPYLSVQYERKSQLVRIHKMPNKTAKETNNALIKTVESLPERMFKTITFDNGSEGSGHLELKEIFNDLETYFCDPYSPWQKGGVENMNKLIRQYLPRNSDITKLSNKDLYEIQEKINNRPRKGLNYLTPNEVINKVVPS